MEFKKISLVNVPEVHEHAVKVAKVVPIVKGLSIGDLVLFGYNLLLIEDLKVLQNPSALIVKARNLSTGITTTTEYPINAIFNRIIEAEIHKMEQMDIIKAYKWKRLRKPILNEMTICGCCGGEVEPIVQYDLDSFNPEDVGKSCGSLAACYDPVLDIFESYDGCEDESTY